MVKRRGAFGLHAFFMSMKRASLLFITALTWNSLSAVAIADERLQLLKDISNAGAPALTLTMLNQAQPSVDEDLYGWILWEQERLTILAKWNQWDQMLVRIEALPIDIPTQFKQQAATYKARAFMQLGQMESARLVLREQLWQSDASEAEAYEVWRQLVIKSYLADGRNEDARIAMLRFDHDFDSQKLDWLLLRASVLIESQRFEQAVTILRGQDTWQAKVTVLYARLQLKQIEHKEVWRRVIKRNKKEGLSSEERASYWALGYFAAKKMSQVDRVVALEALFRLEQHTSFEIFQLPVDLLWKAYVDYAELVGNRAELLIGDDESWFQLASKTSKATPVKSRALFAMLILRSNDPNIINRAGTAYLETFAEIDKAERNLLENLFNRSETFSEAPKIPPKIRYQLVDLALQSADIDEATRLMSGLSTIPEGSSPFDWQLRQSRVLILGGRYDEGSQVLQKLIVEYAEPTAEATDRIMQVLFDLQSVNLHSQAIAHFNQLLSLQIEAKQRREILYWIAESYREQKRYNQAALLYLQSAMLPGPTAMDPWAQTARYHAAENLQLAGLIDDSRRIYESLLAITEDAARRSVLNNKIQQLWLLQGAQ